MTEKLDREHTELLIYKIVSDSQDRLYERLDELHKRNIDDTEVITALRKGGYRELAEGYIDWSGAIDPTYAEDDNTTLNPVVPDPANAPSYAALDDALGVAHTEPTDEGKPSASPGSLVEELATAGIDASNLEQALLDAYSARRIDHGVFYAEMSNDDIHWHIYKKRNHEDSGAYLATANSREGAQSILDSLGTGQP